MNKFPFILICLGLILLLPGCGSMGTGNSFSLPTFTSTPPLPPTPAAIDPARVRQADRLNPPHSLPAGWNTISFPKDSLTGTSGFAYLLYSWNGTGYDLVDPDNPVTIDCHKGFWQYSPAGQDVNCNGPMTGAIRRITLHSGWNFFGLPYIEGIHFYELSMSFNGQTLPMSEAASLNTSPPNTWAYARIYKYTDGGWVHLLANNYSNQLEPWYGYWIFSWVDGATLNFFNPLVSSVDPDSGPAGTEVTISGSNFGGSQNTSVVTFNGIEAETSFWASNEIVCTVPAGTGIGTVPVQVTTMNGSSNNDVVFTVTASPAPHIDSLTPNNGPVRTVVTIDGSNFGADQGSSTIDFNGTLVEGKLFWSDTEIICNCPDEAVTGNVTVTVNGQASNGVLFTVSSPPPLPPAIDFITPDNGTTGIDVTISGFHFGASQGLSTISFNGVGADPASAWCETRIICEVPYTATTGAVTVTVSGQGSNTDVIFTVTDPHINYLAPDSGAIGDTVTIVGYQFGATQGANYCYFNGEYDNILVEEIFSWSDTEIVCLVPDEAISGPVFVVVNGTFSNGGDFTVSGGSYSITGRMMNTDDTGISGTPSVSIVGGSTTIVGTGFSDGSFEVLNVPSGTWELRVDAGTDYMRTKTMVDVYDNVYDLDVPMMGAGAFDSFHPIPGWSTFPKMILCRAMKIGTRDPIPGATISLATPANYTDLANLPGHLNSLDWLNSRTTYYNGYTLFYGVSDGGSEIRWSATKNGYLFPAGGITANHPQTGWVVYQPIYSYKYPTGFTISGNVHDLAGNAAPGLVVEIKDTVLATVTDINGDFTFNDVPYGRQLFRVNHSSSYSYYTKCNQYFNITEDTGSKPWDKLDLMCFTMDEINGLCSPYTWPVGALGMVISWGKEPDGNKNVPNTQISINGACNSQGYLNDQMVMDWDATYAYDDPAVKVFYGLTPDTYTLGCVDHNFSGLTPWEFEGGVAAQVFSGEITFSDVRASNYPYNPDAWFSVAGNVKSYDGSILEGAQVTINKNYAPDPGQGQMVYTTTTNVSGDYDFLDVAKSANRMLFITKSGYKDSHVQFNHRENESWIDSWMFTPELYALMTGQEYYSGYSYLLVQFLNSSNNGLSGVTLNLGSHSQPTGNIGYWDSDHVVNWSATQTYSNGTAFLDAITPQNDLRLSGKIGGVDSFGEMSTSPSEPDTFETYIVKQYPHP